MLYICIDNNIKMKLELKHLAPYLPYGLSFLTENNKTNKLHHKHIDELKGLTNDLKNKGSFIFWGELQSGMTSFYYKCKPILRPISDLLDKNKEFFKTVKRKSLWMDCSNSSYSDFEIDCEELINNTGCISVSVNFKRNNELICIGFFYNDYQWLLENNFDIFGLIPSGLAININDIETIE